MFSKQGRRHRFFVCLLRLLYGSIMLRLATRNTTLIGKKLFHGGSWVSFLSHMNNIHQIRLNIFMGPARIVPEDLRSSPVMSQQVDNELYCKACTFDNRLACKDCGIDNDMFSPVNRSLQCFFDT